MRLRTNVKNYADGGANLSSSESFPAYYLCTVHEVVSCIWRIGRHLGPAQRISHPEAGIYFVTLVHRWNLGDFLFTTGLFIVFLAVFN